MSAPETGRPPASIDVWLHEVQARCDKATPGPWHTVSAAPDGALCYRAIDASNTNGVWFEYRRHPCTIGASMDDMRLVAQARSDLPRALRIIARYLQEFREIEAMSTDDIARQCARRMRDYDGRE